MPEPRLIATHVPPDPQGIVLVLHGGASRADSPMVRQTQLSVLRMIPIAQRVARTTRRHLAVYRLLNSSRGWDADRTPVDDVGWAIEQVSASGRDLPIGLVGHSLGGRAALLSAKHPAVDSVVALNPWVYPIESFGDVSGTEILFVHGTEDRIADPHRSDVLAAAMRRQTAVSYLSVRGGKHAMLRRHAMFSATAADFAADTLLDRPSTGVVKRLRAQGATPVVV